MLLYDKIRFKIVPPLFIIVFTSSVPFIALYGKGEEITWEGIVSGISGNVFSWSVTVITYFWAYFWMMAPCEETLGSKAPDGSVPTYKNNGPTYYVISVLTYLLCQWLWPNISNMIYDNTPQILGSLNIVALVLCVYLYLKSSEGSNLPTMYLFYTGRELHPKMFNVQIKQFIIIRVSLAVLIIQVLAYFFAAWERRVQLDLATKVTCLIQIAYLYKCFIYESTYYFNSLDITLDRPGYYLIWGSSVWMPCLYAFNSLYLVKYQPLITDTTSILILIFGILAIIGTALVDFEKDRFRKTNGKTLVWFKPPTYIKAVYTDQTGTVRKSLLLTSGFWGLARHMNYTLEFSSVASWCLPGYGLGIPVYFLIIFTAVLLLHRIYRAETKCKSKYGKYWDEYCKKVPYRLIPYVF